PTRRSSDAWRAGPPPRRVPHEAGESMALALVRRCAPRLKLGPFVMIASEVPEPTGFARLAAEVREILREQRESYELLLQMTRRDLLLRYKQTVMGFGWAVSMPVLNMIIFSMIFTRVVR